MAPTNNGTADIRVDINGTQVPTMAQHSVVIEMDINQPDMCTTTLRNSPTDGYSKNSNFGDQLEVKITPIGGSQVTVFSGEVVGIEPSWDVKGESKVVLRALNKLHRLGHTKVSKSYVSMSDGDLAQQVAQECGLTLSLGPKAPAGTVWPHVYRHHQTALEFLQDRGGRFNYEFRVADGTLYYGSRDLSKDSGLQLQFGYQAPPGEPNPNIVPLQKYAARIINQDLAAKMTVLGYDATAQAVLTHTENAAAILGSKGGFSHATGGLGAAVEHIDSEIPVNTADEATAVAQAKLSEASLNFLKAEAVTQGSPALKPSIVVTIMSVPGASEPDTRFSGKHYVVSCTHRYSHKSSGGDGGYTCLLKLKRDATNG